MSKDTRTSTSGVSRRAVLGGAGVAVAGGVTLGSAGVLAQAAGAAPPTPAPVAQGQSGQTVVEFVAQITQTGPQGTEFTGSGFLTVVAGLSPDDVGSPTSPVFTAAAAGLLRNRVTQNAIHVIDLDGTLDVFRGSTKVASFDLTLQDVLSVFAPGKGQPSLDGELTQTFAGPIGGVGRTFGRKNQRLRLRASGQGQLVDPVALHATLDIAGTWTAV